MNSKVIPIFKPSMGEEEICAVGEVIRSGWIGLGPKVAEFEVQFAKYVNVGCAIALNSCTAALHLALKVFRVGKGDEVLIPALTFVSTAHAIEYNQATPVFCDIEPDTLCISLDEVKNKITNKTKAIIPVHYGGHPCEMDELLEISRRHNLVVIEDAAHACGAEYNGKKIGSLGDATCFSFHAVKNLSTGDGGMITTGNLGAMEDLRRLRWLGIDRSTWTRLRPSRWNRDPAFAGEEPALNKVKGLKPEGSEIRGYDWYYEVAELGYKYHMNDIAAAIGLVQLKKLDSLNARRRKIIACYNEAFKNIDWIETPIEKPYVLSAWHNYVIKTPYRDELNLYLKDKGIATSVHYMPIHLQPYYRERYKISLPIVERVWKELLTLPLYPDLMDDEVAYILNSIRKFRL